MVALQLAGKDSRSEHGEESYDAVSLDNSADAERATADVAFKPNCLGI